MRFFTGFLIFLGLIVLLFVIILKHGNAPKTAPFNLASYSNSGAVTQLLIDGPINANIAHRQVRITVGATGTNFQILAGYEGHVLVSRNIDNNETSYSSFLQALAVAGFPNGIKEQIPNKQGYCPEGERYTFQLLENDSAILNWWATSCGGQGTYRGNTAGTVQLFEDQVPAYDDLTNDVGF
ncbi:MAG TPA: hypothetical protein VLG47_08000 [Candidatus Saccharimonadales bacterium]|nr:hypothetical protein [Candidatus Saccharimonadales bacterium]